MPSTCQIRPQIARFFRAVAMTPPPHFDDAEPGAIRADLAEKAFSLAQHFDGLPDKQVAAHARAMLRVFRFDRRTLRASAALAGCSRSSLLRAQTILERVLQR